MWNESLRNQLVYPKENIYFAFVVLFSILTYFYLAISIIGIVIIVIIIFLSFTLHGIMIGGIRRNGVRISENQFPDIYEKAVMTAKDMGLTVMPEIYIIESEGMLNAFATRFFRKNMVVLYSGIFELIERGAEKEVLFVLAHEFAHLKRKHVMVGILLLPAMWIPFLGNAYLRACEYTCDRYAAFYVQSFDAAKDALTMLAIGKEMYPKVNKQAYMEQLQTEHGFFVWLNEKLSTHPHLPKRIYALSRFFSDDSTVKLHEPRGRVVLGIFGAFISVIFLSFAIWGGFKAFEKTSFWSETVSGVEGTTPLMIAASENDVDTILKLVTEGIDVNEEDVEGSTALHWAVYNGNIDAANLLLEHGADPNTVDMYEGTPLMSTVFNEDIEMAVLLLRYGADATFMDSEGYTAFDYALEYGYEDFIELLQLQNVNYSSF